MKSPSIKQVGGSHYAKYNVQPVEFFHKVQLPYAEGAIIKYCLRHQDKNGKQDLEKAISLIDFLILLPDPEEWISSQSLTAEYMHYIDSEPNLNIFAKEVLYSIFLWLLVRDRNNLITLRNVVNFTISEVYEKREF